MPRSRRPQSPPGPDAIYQLKVTLRGIRPPIWRRIQVRGNVTLAKLHDILQVAIGWSDYHLHEFTVGASHYGVPDPDDSYEVKQERRARLNLVAPREKARFAYEYDFGDSWEHQVLVEKILPPEPGGRYPRCVAGKRACPPEDVGGIPGYEEFLEAIRDQQHEEHEAMLEWVGGEFDPEEFDLDQVNLALQGGT